MITLLPSVPAHFYHSGYHGYHGHHLCQTRLAIEKRELCHVEYEKECETKTRTFTKITGYEDVDCKEIEVCKFGLCIYCEMLYDLKCFLRALPSPSLSLLQEGS